MEETRKQHQAPGEGTYLSVFVLLAALTVAELLVTTLPILKIPLLLGLATAKAWLVIQFYMHLRYENRLLTWVFLIPVVAGVLATLFIQPLVNGVPR
jgi:cytochrome c oxidase subunit 4